MRFGGRLVMFFAMLIPSILTLITPVIANLDSPAALIVLRFFIGLIHVKKPKNQS
jgi:nitrate/nitrite transporter NarK